MTHFIDASNIYGSEQDDIDAIRLKRGGLLKTSANNLLPFDETGGGCDAPLRGARCFIAGLQFSFLILGSLENFGSKIST